MKNNITLFTCNFNTEKLTMGMLMSFFKQSKINFNDIDVIIMDNGSIPCKTLNKTFNVIDNLNFKLTPNLNQPSKNHCISIDYAFKNIIKTKYVLLVDNDILFYQNLKNIFIDYEKYDCIGEIGYDIIFPDRLFPYFCFINLEKMKNDSINYYDANRIMNIYDKNGEKIKNNGQVGKYDTGASFYEDIKNKSWNIKNIKLNDYLIHLKGASLRKKSYDEFLKENKNLY